MSKDKKKSKTATADVSGYTGQKAIFAGRRISRNERTAWVFVTPTGEERWFGRILGVSIGYTYEIGPKGVLRRPKHLPGERVDNPAWEAQDALVDARNEVKRRQAQIEGASRPAMKAAIEALKPLFREVGYFDYHDLTRHLAHETHLALAKERKVK